jgi:hypothetical protein
MKKLSRDLEPSRIGGRSTEIVSLLLVTAVVIVARCYSPLDDPTFVLCLFRKVTGLPCPGCGMTRSFCALAKGNVHQSFLFHPLGPLVFLAFIVAWVRAAVLLGVDRVGSASRWFNRVQSATIRCEAIARRFRLAHLGLFVVFSVWILRLLKVLGNG